MRSTIGPDEDVPRGLEAGQLGGGPSRGRVARLTVEHPGGTRRGSGYLVADGRVLTAAHVIDRATNVFVRFEPGSPTGWGTDAERWWGDLDSDLGVITIPTSGNRTGPAVEFGRLSHQAAVITVHALGFPWWKMRNSDGTLPVEGDGKQRFRELSYVVGTVPVLANAIEQTLEMVVPAPPAARRDGLSPWEGMSGAVLWAGSRIVGVITQHHPGEGLARLAAARVDAALEDLLPDASELRALLPGLPTNSAGLVDVLPPGAHALTVSAYQAVLTDIAPEQIIGRDSELEQLVRFCASNESYLWWQAGPWAGKSALMAWFALHPPAGVDVVSFFITSRYVSQSDSDAFTDALIEQLAALTGEHAEPLREARARYGHLLRLLEKAAANARATMRRVLLVVDGLDEDTSATGRPSIASLLPSKAPLGLQILVASRPHPGLPDDVNSSHPLRAILAQRRERRLEPSPFAQDVAFRAKHELKCLLAGPRLHREVAGLITASGGGLTAIDLEELTGEPPFELEPLLGSVFGRTVSGRVSASAPPARSAERVYLFAHETLRELAVQQFGNSLDGYRRQLYAWAETYRSNGWPSDTPTYLLRGYTRMLASVSDVTRIVEFATDSRRHDRMLELTGGDSLALSELATIIDGESRRAFPNLGVLLVLSYVRAELARRNDHIPEGLPRVWALLGSPDRALASAEGISAVRIRTRVLYALCEIAFSRSDHDRAVRIATRTEEAARGIPEVETQALVRARVARGLVALGEYDRATGAIRDLPIYSRRPQALIDVASALTAADEHDRAAQLITLAEHAARNITDPEDRPRALTDVASALTAADEHDRAAQLITLAEHAARNITDPEDRPRALIDVASALTAADEHDRAAQLITLAEHAARNITDPEDRPRALIDVASALTAADEHDRAAQLITLAEHAARNITDPEDRPRALIDVASALTAADEHDRAAQLITLAEHAARNITNLDHRARALIDIAQSVATAGQSERAAQLALRLPYSDRQPWGLGGVVQALVTAGENDLAAQLTLEIADHFSQTWAAAQVAQALVTAGQHIRAAHLALDLPDSGRRPWALAQVARALAAAGEHGQAAQLFAVADRTARDIPYPESRAQALTDVAQALAVSGEDGRAAQLATLAEVAARDVPDPENRATALANMSRALILAGDHDRAVQFTTLTEQAAHDVRDPRLRVEALGLLPEALLTAGDHAQAVKFANLVERAADDVSDPDFRLRVLGFLAQSMARCGENERAGQLVDLVQHAAHEVSDSNRRARALGFVALKFAMAGEDKRTAQFATLAEQAAASVEDPERRASTLIEVAQALAIAGEHHGAARIVEVVEPTVRQLSSLESRALALVDIARVWIAAEEDDRSAQLIAIAEHAASDISGPSDRGRTLVKVAEVLIQANEPHRAAQIASVAEQAARDVSEDIVRAQLLTEVAHILITAADTTAGRTKDRAAGLHEMIAEALQVSWDLPLGVIAQLDPSAVTALADFMIHFTSSPGRRTDGS